MWKVWKSDFKYRYGKSVLHILTGEKSEYFPQFTMLYKTTTYCGTVFHGVFQHDVEKCHFKDKS